MTDDRRDIQGVQGASLRGRPTPPATLAQEGKVHEITRSGQEVDD